MEISFNILINSTTIFQIVIFTGFILLTDKRSVPAFLQLILIFVIFFGSKFDSYLQESALILSYPNWAFWGETLTLIQGQVIYHYVSTRTDVDFKLNSKQFLHYLWILPPAIYLTLYWWRFDSATKIDLLSSGEFINSITILVLPIYSDVLMLSYMTLSILKLKKHGIEIQNWFSTIEDRNLSGLRVLISMFAVLIVLHLVSTITQGWLFQLEVSEWLFSVLAAFHLIFVNGLFIEAISNPHIPLEQEQNKEDNKQVSKYDHSQQEQLISELDQLLAKNPLYLDADLTVTQLAKYLKVHGRSLSNALNRIKKCNFYQYINGLRIESSKELLVKKPKKNILDVAYESGFNSKSVFNTAFKKYESMTPSKFRKVNCSDSGIRTN